MARRSSRAASKASSRRQAAAPAAPSSRALWKGAISFGLVHIPVALHPATQDSGIDFDWLDKRTLDRVGYKRVNKRTGKEVAKDHIVKGVAYERGRYVVLDDKEIAAAYPEATQTIDIERFVAMPEIPFTMLDRPYYLAPVGQGAKVYALLREALLSTGRIGLARVVLHTRQHLAALVASGPALVLNLLRWGDDIRTWEGLGLPAEGRSNAGVSTRELAMAEQLIQDMSGSWQADEFRDSFKEQVMALVKKKVAAGQTRDVSTDDERPTSAPPTADIIDLTELLKRSLRAGKSAEAAPSTTSGKRKTPSSTSRSKRAA